MKQINNETFTKAVKRTQEGGARLLGPTVNQNKLITEMAVQTFSTAPAPDFIYKAGFIHGFILAGGLEEGGDDVSPTE